MIGRRPAAALAALAAAVPLVVGSPRPAAAHWCPELCWHYLGAEGSARLTDLTYDHVTRQVTVWVTACNLTQLTGGFRPQPGYLKVVVNLTAAGRPAGSVAAVSTVRVAANTCLPGVRTPTVTLPATAGTPVGATAGSVHLFARVH